MDLIESILTKRVPVLIDTSLLYTERCYQVLIEKLLTREGFNVASEIYVAYETDGILFGQGRIDLLVTLNDIVVIIELKANTQGIQSSIQQVKRYMKHYKSNRKKVIGMLAMYNVNGRQIVFKKIV